VHSRIGDQVEARQPLATLLVGDRPVDEERVVGRIRKAFTIGSEPVDAPDLILGTPGDIAE
jgi:hypothetical protein